MSRRRPTTRETIRQQPVAGRVHAADETGAADDPNAAFIKTIHNTTNTADSGPREQSARIAVWPERHRDIKKKNKKNFGIRGAAINRCQNVGRTRWNFVRTLVKLRLNRRNAYHASRKMSWRFAATAATVFNYQRVYRVQALMIGTALIVLKKK